MRRARYALTSAAASSASPPVMSRNVPARPSGRRSTWLGHHHDRGRAADRRRGASRRTPRSPSTPSCCLAGDELHEVEVAQLQVLGEVEQRRVPARRGLRPISPDGALRHRAVVVDGEHARARRREQLDDRVLEPVRRRGGDRLVADLVAEVCRRGRTAPARGRGGRAARSRRRLLGDARPRPAAATTSDAERDRDHRDEQAGPQPAGRRVIGPDCIGPGSWRCVTGPTRAGSRRRARS